MRSPETIPDVPGRWLLSSDISDALDIERESFDDPLNLAEFRRLMNTRRMVALLAEVGPPSTRPRSRCSSCRRRTPSSSGPSARSRAWTSRSRRPCSG